MSPVVDVDTFPPGEAVENVVDCQLKKQEQETVLRILSISHQRKKERDGAGRAKTENKRSAV